MAMVCLLAAQAKDKAEWYFQVHFASCFFCNLQNCVVFLFDFFTNHCTIVLCLIFVFRILKQQIVSFFQKNKLFVKNPWCFLEDVFLLSFWKDGRFPIWTSLVAVPPIASRAPPGNRRVSFRSCRSPKNRVSHGYIAPFKWKMAENTWLNEVILGNHPTFIWGEIT